MSSSNTLENKSRMFTDPAAGETTDPGTTGWHFPIAEVHRGGSFGRSSSRPVSGALDLVIPAYNQERRIGPSVEQLAGIITDWLLPVRLVVVDNGSVDRTASAVDAFAKQIEVDLTVISRATRGEGAAVRAGVGHSTGEYIGFRDVDLPVPPDALGGPAGIMVTPFDIDSYAHALRAVATDPATGGRAWPFPPRPDGRPPVGCPGRHSGPPLPGRPRGPGIRSESNLRSSPGRPPRHRPNPRPWKAIDIGDGLAMKVTHHLLEPAPSRIPPAPAPTAGPGRRRRPAPPPDRHQPEAIAVDDGTRRYSYAELGAMVAGLAQRIRKAGVEPGSAVAVCLPRSIEAFVSLLGILEAGGVYVPLDPGMAGGASSDHVSRAPVSPR